MTSPQQDAVRAVAGLQGGVGAERSGEHRARQGAAEVRSPAAEAGVDDEDFDALAAGAGGVPAVGPEPGRGVGPFRRRCRLVPAAVTASRTRPTSATGRSQAARRVIGCGSWCGRGVATDSLDRPGQGRGRGQCDCARLGELAKGGLGRFYRVRRDAKSVYVRASRAPLGQASASRLTGLSALRITCALPAAPRPRLAVRVHAHQLRLDHRRQHQHLHQLPDREFRHGRQDQVGRRPGRLGQCLPPAGVRGPRQVRAASAGRTGSGRPRCGRPCRRRSAAPSAP